MGENPGRGNPEALARNILKFLPWELSHGLLLKIEGWPWEPAAPAGWIQGGFLLVWVLALANVAGILFFPQRKTLYDLLTGTQVVHRPRG